MSSMMTDLANQTNREEHTDNKIYSNDLMTSLVETMASEIKTNNLKEFKKFLEENPSNLSDHVNDIRYTYNLDLQIYSKDTSKITKLNPSTVFSSFGFMSQGNMMENTGGMNMMGNRIDVFNELSENTTLIKNTYDILAGRLPKSKEEVI